MNLNLAVITAAILLFVGSYLMHWYASAHPDMDDSRAKMLTILIVLALLFSVIVFIVGVTLTIQDLVT